MTDAPSTVAGRPRAGVVGRTGPPPPRGRRARDLVGPLLIVALVAFAVWRFTDADSTPRRAAAQTLPRSLAEEVASLVSASLDRPDDLTVWQRLGTAYAQLAHQNADPTLYAKSAAAFDRADAIVPDAPATTVARAEVQAVLHQFAEAHRLTSIALATNPIDPDALVIRVDAEIELGRYDDATASLQTLLDVKPGMAALARASYLRELHGDLDGALLALRQAEIAGAQAAPAVRAQTMRIRGDVLFNHGRTDDAATVYEQILDIEPGYADARIGLARVAVARGDVDGAIASVEQLLTEVDDPHAWIALAELQLFAGRQDAHAASVAKVRDLLLAEAANGSSIDLELALFDADHDGEPPAVVVERAARAYGVRPSVHGADVLAWALHRADRSIEAVPYVEEALRLGSVDATMRYHAAAVFAATGDHARAANELDRAFTLNPWFNVALHGEALALAADLGVPVPAAWG
jgi:tetratricopeptide (TPR) repeat protein